MTVYNDQFSEYITRLFAQPDEVLQFTQKDTVEQGLPAINVKPEEGRFLQFLVRACGAKCVVEIGTLGGYSGIWMARGLPEGGRLITLEKEPRHAEIARRHFERAGLLDKIEIRMGDAHASLVELAKEGPIDFVFIDAEKPGYPDYFDWALDNLRVGGVLAMHNAFRKGSILGLAEKDQYTGIMQELNPKIAANPRLISTIYPAGDGTLIGVKIA